MRRRGFAVAAAALAAVLLSGCAPDPQAVEAHAEAVFTDVVTAVSDIDVEVVRTLDVAAVEAVACETGGGTQQMRVATATLSVGAQEQDATTVFDAVRGQLPSDEWDPIGFDDTLIQRAWGSDDGLVAAVTAAGPTIVVSVFTPCRG